MACPPVPEWALFVAYGDLYVWSVVLGGRGHRVARAIGGGLVGPMLHLGEGLGQLVGDGLCEARGPTGSVGAMDVRVYDIVVMLQLS